MEEVQIVFDEVASDLSTTMADGLKNSMQRELDTIRRNSKEPTNTIFLTPQNISQSKKHLFEPSVISIGPFHRGRKHLQAMEETKWRFLHTFLSYTMLDLCISEMKMLEQRARQCYTETFDLDSNAFVKMMLLDGCFVLEYFFQLYGNPHSNSIVEDGLNSQFIDRDLLLLENQIPFFIVEKLFDIRMNLVSSNIPWSDFVEYIGRILLTQALTDPIDYIDYEFLEPEILEPPVEIHHLVHLCYHYLVPYPKKPVVLSSKSGFLSWVLPRRFSDSTYRGLPWVIPSATELKEAGLKFKPKRNPKNMLDVSFEYGVLKIPRLAIADATKPFFANLIAFEQSKYGKEHLPFTSFVAFLDNLINTQYDVTILRQCGIIVNGLGSEDELAYFINDANEGTFRHHYLTELYIEVNRFNESSWNKHRAKLIRDYFSSPWTVISLIAALILLVLTCVQTFYSIYAYKFPPSS